MAAVMTSDYDDTDRLAIEITECKHMGLKVLLPDVNESFVEFGVVPDTNQIRFGMAAVKGVGTGAVEEILRAREDGHFVSVEDFVKRVSTRIVNRKAWESLIKAGAFDTLGDRSDLLFNLDTILAFGSKQQKDALSGQADLFGELVASSSSAIPSIKLDTAPAKHSDRETLQWERELLGLYLSSHPLDKYDSYFQEQTLPLVDLKKEMDGKTATVGGVITTVRQIVTKNGAKMAFVGLEDKSGETELIVFPSTYEESAAHFVQDNVVKVKGKVNAKDREGKIIDEIKIMADEVTSITEQELDSYHATGRKMKAPKTGKSVGAKVTSATPKFVYTPVDDRPAISVTAVVPQKLYIHVKDPNDHDSLTKLKRTFNDYPGQSEVILVLGEDKKSAIRLPFKTEPSDELCTKIGELYGAECVALK